MVGICSNVRDRSLSSTPNKIAFQSLFWYKPIRNLRQIGFETIVTIHERFLKENGSQMFLKNVHIKNFRGIEDLSLSLNDTCVLIGENNTGKTSILDAIRICMEVATGNSQVSFESYDYHLRAKFDEPAVSPSIEITLTFSEREVAEWHYERTARLQEVEIVDEQGLKSYVVRFTSGVNAKTGITTTAFEFLNRSGVPYRLENRNTFLNELRQMTPIFYLSSVRDALSEFSSKSNFWHPLIKALDISESDKRKLEESLYELNIQFLESSKTLEEVNEHLNNIGEIMKFGYNNLVSIDAIPAKIPNVLSQTRVNLKSKTGAKIPIERHGGGTQSIAVIGLFEVFLKLQLDEQYGALADPFLALEEPEAHLHPSAIKALGEMCQKIPGQKIITTHSGELLTSVKLENIRRLKIQDRKISVFQLQNDTFNGDELSDIIYFLESRRETLLFARCWLLMEGKTEATILPACAVALGYDLVAEGVYCIEFSQVGIEKLIKLAEDFGIEWFVIADGDHEGMNYVRSAKYYLKGRLERAHIYQLEYTDIETYLCYNGFGNIYEESLTRYGRQTVYREKIDLEKYWEFVLNNQVKKAKFRNALTIAKMIVDKNEKNALLDMTNIIKRTIRLARNENDI